MRYNIFLFLTLFLSLIYSNSVNLDLPAVSSENLGSLVNLNITAINGTGEIYFSIPPYVGVSYQESYTQAFNYIKSQNKNLENYDFYITFSNEKTSLVEGASGGVATAVIIKSLMENVPVNESIIITGEINSMGNILPVGGIPEKLIASYFSNKSMILIPSSSSVNEKVICEKLSEGFSFPVYEYDSFNSVYDVYTKNNLRDINLITLSEDNFSNVYNLPEVETHTFFNVIVFDMLTSYNNNMVSLLQNYPQFMPYFNSIQEGSSELYNKGYSYSAGNELFLTLETISYLTSSYSDDEFTSKEDDVYNCLEITKKNLDMFEGTLEYYIASEVRYVKAKDTIDSYVNESDKPSIRIYAPALLLRSELWCVSAESMSTYNKDTDFDREKVKSFVENKLILYSGNFSSLLNTARQYYAEGYYGASLNEIISYEAELFNCTDYNFTYDWSKMMYNHAVYLNSSDKYGNNSYNEISKYACSYEGILREYNSLEKIEEESKFDNICMSVCVLLIFILFILSILYYVLNRGWING